MTQPDPIKTIEEILTSLCEDCDGKGYTETGGMAMEDDLAEKRPCENKLHDSKSTAAIVELVSTHQEAEINKAINQNNLDIVHGFDFKADGQIYSASEIRKVKPQNATLSADTGGEE